MAENKSSFNLLYKVEAQKTFIDRLYDVLIGPVRIVIVGVMAVIIAVFGYRFFLDTTLRDQKRLAEDYTRQVQNIVKPNEQNHRDVLEKTESYVNYMELYKSLPEQGGIEPTGSNEVGKLHFTARTFEEVLNIKNTKYSNTITIANYSVINQQSDTEIRVTGAASTFITVDQFVNDIKALGNVRDASSTNLGSTREDIPRYQIDIKLIP